MKRLGLTPAAVYWWSVVTALVVLNLIVLVVAAVRGGVLWGPVPLESLSAGLRSEWVQVDKPWLTEGQSLAQASSRFSGPGAVSLSQGKQDLKTALSEAQNKVNEEVSPQQFCLLWGPLLPDQKQRVADALGKWSGARQEIQRRESLGFIVVVPKSRVLEGENIASLSKKGVSDVFFIGTPGPLQGGISVGMFRSKERANAQLSNLKDKGVLGAEVRERPGPIRTFFELKGTALQINEVRQIHTNNPRGELSECEVEEAQ
ncbi:MAG: hypothetical protein QE278_08340 [Limnobacter sp.]|nr:hypothetical protein [Limnobacter sp.]